MEHVVLVIHLVVAVVMIVLIMLQRSEGGGLGMGTGGGLGNLASAQSTASALTKITTYVAMLFFVTSIILAIMAARGGQSQSILDAATSAPTAAETATEKPSEPPTVPIAK
jgi:preprotein translocase subunit SecG